MNNNYNYCLPYNQTNKGKHAYSITGLGVEVAYAGTPSTYYDVSGITAYSTGLNYTYTEDEEVITAIYAGNGDNVSLSLSGGNKYYASAGSLSGSTLIMPAENVTISDAKVLADPDGNWNTASNWIPAGVPTAEDYVTVYYDVTIPANCVAKANHIYVTNGARLTIAEGGQLQHSNADVEVTMQKSITGYSGTKDHFYLMALPFEDYYTIAGSSLVSGTYDLYKFNGASQDAEWVNYKPNGTHPFTTLGNGEGFLYANTADRTLSLTGELEPIPSSGSKTIQLAYDANTTFGAWNLVGNPFACNATFTTTSSITDYYVIGENDLIAKGDENVILPLQGIFVKASDSGKSITFSPVTENSPSNSISSVNFILKPTDTRDANIIDVARVRFDEGEGLEKFQLNPNHTKIYIPQNGTDYAVVYTQAEGELPLNLKVEENGRYTLSVDIEKVSFDYLHLIDNMTGDDVDLLATPSYTFNARKTDYASRFKLVFDATGIEENGASTGSATFAYYNGSEWVIDGASTGSATCILQVIDMMGRVLSSESINGTTTKAINAAQGIYMLRLVNGNDVKVQKIVVR